MKFYVVYRCFLYEISYGQEPIFKARILSSFYELNFWVPAVPVDSLATEIDPILKRFNRFRKLLTTVIVSCQQSCLSSIRMSKKPALLQHRSILDWILWNRVDPKKLFMKRGFCIKILIIYNRQIKTLFVLLCRKF